MITSQANERIKGIRRLKERKFRQQTGLFLVEGVRIVIEAIRQAARVETLIFAPELLTSEIGIRTVNEQISKGTPILEVSAAVFQSISDKEGPQGLAAVVKQQWKPLDEIFIEKGLWVALDSVADPGNLGTILRTTEAAGGVGVILLDQSTDPYDPAAVRASMGAVFDLTLVRTTFEDFVKFKKRVGFFMAGTDGEAETDYRDVDYPQPMVLLMGSEREGLLPKHYQACDIVVRIPMMGRSDSLNLAVATGIALYGILDQWYPSTRRKH